MVPIIDAFATFRDHFLIFVSEMRERIIYTWHVSHSIAEEW
jgi:hypothetical protein